MLGRRRPVWDIDSKNHLHREAAKRMAINMPIQGTNAEMIKLAMVAIQKKLKVEKMESKMILQIHDELVFEVDKEALKETTCHDDVHHGRAVTICICTRDKCNSSLIHKSPMWMVIVTAIVLLCMQFGS